MWDWVPAKLRSGLLCPCASSWRWSQYLLPLAWPPLEQAQKTRDPLHLPRPERVCSNAGPSACRNVGCHGVATSVYPSGQGLGCGAPQLPTWRPSL